MIDPTRWTVSLLEPLGLGRAENDVYFALLELRRADADAVAEHLDMTGRAARNALGTLVSAGLAIASTEDTHAVYRPVTPEVAVAALVDQRRTDLARVQVQAEELAARLRQDHRGDDESLVELAEGEDAVIAAVTKLQLDAREEILAVDTQRHLREPMLPNKVQFQRMAQGVAYRVIYSPEALATPGHLAYLRRCTQAGEQARILADVGTRIIIADRRVAFLPVRYGPATTLRRLVVHAPAMVQLLVEHFELLWQRATPVGLDPLCAPGIEARDQQILTLLAAGVKDITIGRTLGVTDRTVSRRVAELMRVLGAETRFQAGILAARRGWL